MKRGLETAVKALLLLALGLSLRCGEPPVILRPGDAAPAFTLTTLEGGQVSLADYRGRVVFVRFWADWCKSCRVEMPWIEEKYRELEPAGLTVLAVNVRQGREAASRFASEVGITYPVLLDSEGRTAGAYGVLGLPTTFLVDRDGKIREEIVGDMNRRSLAELLGPLFAEQARAGSGGAP